MMNNSLQIKFVNVNKSYLFDNTNKFCNDESMDLKDRFLIACQKAGVSQTDIAHAVHVKPQTIQAIASGKTRNPRRITAIADFLGVEPEWLLFGKESQLNTIEDVKKMLKPLTAVLPLLQNHEILPWVKHGILPKVKRSIEMAVFAKLSEKSYVVDITDEAITYHLFSNKTLNMRVMAFFDPTATPEVNDIVVAEIDGRITYRQYIKNGNEHFLKSYEMEPLIKCDSRVFISGVIKEYRHFYDNQQNVDQKKQA